MKLEGSRLSHATASVKNLKIVLNLVTDVKELLLEFKLTDARVHMLVLADRPLQLVPFPLNLTRFPDRSHFSHVDEICVWLQVSMLISALFLNTNEFCRNSFGLCYLFFRDHTHSWLGIKVLLVWLL